MRLPTIFILIIAFQILLVSAMEFNVGGEKGWAVQPPKDDNHYNAWSSENRFQVGDTINFEYKGDSVLVVTQEEYDKCSSARPMFFSNNGNTVYKLEHSGLYYFISGVSGHCSRGLRMVIKVLETASPPPAPRSANDKTMDSPTSQGGAIELKTAFLPIIIPIVGCLFM